MPKIFIDQFVDLQIARQARYRLRRRAEGRCPYCGRLAWGYSRCKRHLRKARASSRRYRGNHKEKVLEYNEGRRKEYRRLRSLGYLGVEARRLSGSLRLREEFLATPRLDETCGA
jgi:hypothetical protein